MLVSIITPMYNSEATIAETIKSVLAQTYSEWEMVIVDDLKPGYDMARAYHVPFVGAGWSNNIPEIRNFMKKNSDFYFTKVEELYPFLFDS